MITLENSGIQYTKKNGCVFIIDENLKTVHVPQSFDETDYPQEIKDALKTGKYFKQLTIE